MSTAHPAVEVLPVTGIGEVLEGTDLAAVIAERADLVDGDIVVVTSKVVSKAEGRSVRADRREAAESETVRVLARRGETAIVRNRQGLVLAGAGVDASNTEAGTVLLLPVDPDASARRLRVGLADRTGRQVGVVVSDTAGRAWRQGQTDIAIGAAGVLVADDHAGRVDPYGNELAVTVAALADELAAAADLVKGKLRQCPVAVVRGLAHLVTEEDGPGASSLQRTDAEDLFGLGARQAVLAAVGAVAVDQSAFGARLPASELAAVLTDLPGQEVQLVIGVGAASVTVEMRGGTSEDRARVGALVDAVCFACGWTPTPSTASDPSAALRTLVPST